MHCTILLTIKGTTWWIWTCKNYWFSYFLHEDHRIYCMFCLSILHFIDSRWLDHFVYIEKFKNPTLYALKCLSTCIYSLPSNRKWGPCLNNVCCNGAAVICSWSPRNLSCSVCYLINCHSFRRTWGTCYETSKINKNTFWFPLVRYT